MAAMRCRRLAAIAVAMAASALGVAPAGATEEPPEATVSQGGVTVPLGYERNCSLLSRDCIAIDYAFGINPPPPYEIHELPLVTPGTVRVRAIVPVHFVGARSSGSPKLTKAGPGLAAGLGFTPLREVGGIVSQQAPAEATIRFPQTLSSGEFAGVVVQLNVEGRSRSVYFSFFPIEGLTISRVSCHRRVAEVALHVRTVGTLTLDAGGSRVVRSLSTPGRRMLHLRVPMAHRGSGCHVAATLTNPEGTERALARPSSAG